MCLKICSQNHLHCRQTQQLYDTTMFPLMVAAHRLLLAIIFMCENKPSRRRPEDDATWNVNMCSCLTQLLDAPTLTQKLVAQICMNPMSAGFDQRMKQQTNCLEQEPINVQICLYSLIHSVQTVNYIICVHLCVCLSSSAAMNFWVLQQAVTHKTKLGCFWMKTRHRWHLQTTFILCQPKSPIPKPGTPA